MRIVATSKDLGVALPEPVADAHELTKVPPVRIVAPTPEELTTTLGAAVAAGRDPVTNKAVTTLVMHKSLSTMLPDQQITDYRLDLLGAAVVEHADAIVDSWRSVVAGDAEALIAARSVLGDNDLDTPPHNPRPGVPAAWRARSTRPSAPPANDLSTRCTYLYFRMRSLVNASAAIARATEELNALEPAIRHARVAVAAAEANARGRYRRR